MHPFVFVTLPPPANASCDLYFPCDDQLAYILPAFWKRGFVTRSCNYVEALSFAPEGEEKIEQVARGIRHS